MTITCSFDQRQPPTPTRTPTSPSFTDIFKTPKFESSFYDPRVNWNTADPNLTSPNLLRTPKPLSFGSNNGSQPNDLDFLANAQHLLATPDFSTLPVGSSFGSNPKESDSQTINHQALTLDTNFEAPSNIQTPPPTTTSATRRQGKKAQNVKPTTSPGSKRKSVPILPKPAGSGNIGAAAAEASPGELDFSPAQFGWAPATAPAYPRQKLFLEPFPDDSMNLDLPAMSFDNPRAGLEAFVSTHPSISSSQQTITDGFGYIDDNTPMASFDQTMHSFDTQATGQILQGVDPSLLFSSPGRSNDLNSDTTIPDDAMQPYAYQMQEARREKAYHGVAKPRRRRKPSVDSPAVIAALESLREDAPRPVLHRSMTESALPRLNYEAARTLVGHGRSSPLKTIRRSKQKQSKRTSIALMVDENGRARAEATSASEREENMEIDGDSESSCAASSVDNIDEEMITTFTGQPGPKLGQFGRSNHSQKSSNASSFYSTSSRDRVVGTGRRGMIPEDESEAETVLNSEDDGGHAQDQLRRTLQERQRRTSTHHLYSPHGPSSAFLSNADLRNLSPTTISDPELPSPFSDRGPSHSEIRCVCGTTLDDGQMIQW